MTSFRTLDDLGDVQGKRALVRVDLNVPMQDGVVTDDTRLRATLPTVTELADKGAIVLLLAHFGRPKAPTPEYSLALVRAAYESVLGRPVRYVGLGGRRGGGGDARAGRCRHPREYAFLRRRGEERPGGGRALRRAWAISTSTTPFPPLTAPTPPPRVSPTGSPLMPAVRWRRS